MVIQQVKNFFESSTIDVIQENIRLTREEHDRRSKELYLRLWKVAVAYYCLESTKIWHSERAVERLPVIHLSR